MAQWEVDQKIGLPIANRMQDALTVALGKERERAGREGVPAVLAIQSALHALVRVTAFYALHLISPEPRIDPNSDKTQARVQRIEVALSQALHRIMETEMGAPEKGHA